MFSRTFIVKKTSNSLTYTKRWVACALDELRFGFCLDLVVCVCKTRTIDRVMPHRKRTFDEDLSQVLWRQLLRGPRPPSVQWPHSRRNTSAVDHQFPAPKKGKGKGSGQAKGVGKGSQQQAPRHNATGTVISCSSETTCSSGRSSPFQSRQTQARARHFGEEDDMYPAVQEALSKAEYQAREQPVCERIRSTKSFVERKQSEWNRPSKQQREHERL